MPRLLEFLLLGLQFSWEWLHKLTHRMTECCFFLKIFEMNSKTNYTSSKYNRLNLAFLRSAPISISFMKLIPVGFPLSSLPALLAKTKGLQSVTIREGGAVNFSLQRHLIRSTKGPPMYMRAHKCMLGGRGNVS